MSHPSTTVLQSHYLPLALKAESIDVGDLRPTESAAIRVAFERMADVRGEDRQVTDSWLDLARRAVRRGLGEQRLFELRRTS